MRPEPIANWKTLAGSDTLFLLFIYCCVLLERAAQRQLKVPGFCPRERSESGSGDVPKKLGEALNWSGGQSGESWESRRAEVRWRAGVIWGNRSKLGKQELAFIPAESNRILLTGHYYLCGSLEPRTPHFSTKV